MVYGLWFLAPSPMPHAPCAVCLVPCVFYIQFLLKKYARAKAVPNIAIIVTKPPKERTAIPLSAEPLVQPRPSWEPKPKSTPPDKARMSLLREVIEGECSTLNFNRPAKAPDKNPPTRTPIISKTSQVFIGLP